MDAFKGAVAATLPLAARVHSLPLARRRPRRDGERHLARLFLPRLLLDAHGAPIRRRDNEPRLDRRHRAAGVDREDPAVGVTQLTGAVLVAWGVVILATAA